MTWHEESAEETWYERWYELDFDDPRVRERINKGPWHELDLELDRTDPWVWVRTNKDGRRYKVPLNPGDHPLFPGSKRKVSHPADARGYACAASNAYQTLLLDLFTAVSGQSAF
jgi:hypothetical protein